MTASSRDQSPGTAHVAPGDVPGVRVRRMEDVDLERILELRTAVRWSADPEAFGFLRGMGEARWAVAELEEVPGALVGMAGAVPLGETGIVCHLAVHGDYRQKGLGAGLTGWAVSYLRSRGVRRLRLDSTGEAEGLYRSLGFVPVGCRSVYRLEGAGDHSRESRTGECRVSPLSARDLPEVFGADRWSTGADRSALILATLRLRAGDGLVARDRSGVVKGYLLRSPSERGVRIGPFLAGTPGTARRLLSRALAGDGGERPVEVTVPGGGPAHPLLAEFGFEGREDRRRMELGGSPVEPGSAGLAEYATTPYLAT